MGVTACRRGRRAGGLKGPVGGGAESVPLPPAVASQVPGAAYSLGLFPAGLVLDGALPVFSPAGLLL